MKYIPIPIEGDEEVSIMFDVLSLHQELSNIDLYLEIEDNESIQDKEMACRTQESVLLEERSSELPSNTSHANVMSEMIQNDDFSIISQIAVVNNAMNSGFDMDDEFDAGDMLEDDKIIGEDETDNYTRETERSDIHVDGMNYDIQVPSAFTSFWAYIVLL